MGKNKQAFNIHEYNDIYDHFVKIQQSSSSDSSEPNVPQENNIKASSNIEGFQHNNNPPYVSKFVPKKISVDKEQLYLENLELKSTINTLQSQVIKAKSSIEQLKAQLSEKNRMLNDLTSSQKPAVKKYLTLTENLKQSIKEANLNIRVKEDEINQLRKNKRSSVINELKTELNVYVEECKRLKKIIEDNNQKDKEMGMKIDYQVEMIENLKKDNQKFRELLEKHIQENKGIQEKMMKEANGSKVSKKNRIKKLKVLALDNAQLRKKLEITFSETHAKEMNAKCEISYLRRKIEEYEKILNDQQEQLKTLKSEGMQEKKVIEMKVVTDSCFSINPEKYLKGIISADKMANKSTQSKLTMNSAVKRLEREIWERHNTNLSSLKMFSDPIVHEISKNPPDLNVFPKSCCESSLIGKNFNEIEHPEYNKNKTSESIGKVQQFQVEEEKINTPEMQSFNSNKIFSDKSSKRTKIIQYNSDQPEILKEDSPINIEKSIFPSDQSELQDIRDALKVKNINGRDFRDSGSSTPKSWENVQVFERKSNLAKDIKKDSSITNKNQKLNRAVLMPTDHQRLVYSKSLKNSKTIYQPPKFNPKSTDSLTKITNLPGLTPLKNPKATQLLIEPVSLHHSPKKTVKSFFNKNASNEYGFDDSITSQDSSDLIITDDPLKSFHSTLGLQHSSFIINNTLQPSSKHSRRIIKKRNSLIFSNHQPIGKLL